MRKNNIKLQDLAELMRDVAYSDDRTHKISWSLYIVHPKTNDGDIGYSGGLWHSECDPKDENRRSVSLSYSEIRGIHGFKLWRGKSEVRFSFEERPTIEEFKEVLIKEFGVKELYKHN
jgi:hypothetical protein